MDSLAVPGSNGTDRHLHARKSFDGGVRPAFQQQLRSTPSAYSLNAANGSGSALSIPNGETSRRAKRQSINPAVAQSFKDSSSSAHASPSTTSPLREYFTDGTGPENLAFTRIASSSRPSTPSSPRTSLDRTPSQIGRTRSGSAGVPNQRTFDQDRLSRTPSRSGSRLNSPASRSSSRATDRLAPQPQTADRSDYTPRSSSLRAHEHRRPPSLILPNSNIKHQRSFDDRARASPMRDNQSYNGSLEVSSSRPPSIPTPTSPSHRVDVPHGVESGTDTEAESEDSQDRTQRDVPPALPPKEPPSARSARPTLNRLNTGSSVSVNTLDDGRQSSEDHTVESPESSPVERTSHATFIAPALPPIRISMGNSDFSELLKSVGGDVTKLEQLAEVMENGSRELDLTATSPQVLVASKRDSLALSTPRSDVTVTESAEPSPETRLDDTPVKRSATRQRGLSTGIGGTMSSSPSFSSSTTTDVISRFPGVPRTRPSLEKPTRGDDSLDATFGHEGLNSSTLTPTRITVGSDDDSVLETPQFTDTLKTQLQDKLATALDDGNTHVALDIDLVQTLLSAFNHQKTEYANMKRKLDGIRVSTDSYTSDTHAYFGSLQRASQHYMDGLTVAQTEYDRELKARRDAEAEVTRLRVLLSGQAARLSAISGETKRQEAQKLLSEELSNNLSTLGRSLSQLKVERDMALAEVEQLSVSKRYAHIVMMHEFG